MTNSLLHSAEALTSWSWDIADILKSIVKTAIASSAGNQRWLEATSMRRRTEDSMGRWNASSIPCTSRGLRKLFPEACFVHMFRDVDAVVRSMVQLPSRNRNSVGSDRRRSA